MATPTSTAPGPAIDSVQYLTLDLILPNPNQPRKNFDEEALAGLASSIRKEGVIQPIIVTPLLTVETAPLFIPSDKLPEGKTHADYIGKHLIIAGQRRWMASRLADKKVVPSIVREIKAEDMTVISATENLTRTDMTVAEEGAVYKFHSEQGWTADRIATQYGKHRTHVQNMLGIMELPKEVVDALSMTESECDKSKVYPVSMSHARWLKSLKGNDEVILSLLARIQKDGVSVRWVEEQVKEAQARLKAGQESDEVADGVATAPKTTQASTTGGPAPDPSTVQGATPAGGTTTPAPAPEQVNVVLSDEIVAAIKSAKTSLKTGVKYIPGEPEGRLEIQIFGMSDLARILQVLGVPAELAQAVLKG